ncbi:DDE_3 domain-containing protein [Trichonephila clavipes]|nr:DDE_3 domain-containing protein [Trichonephila clavipes]
MFNLCKQFQDTGSVERKPRQGLPRALMAREDLHWSFIAMHSRDTTASTALSLGPHFILMDDNARPHRVHLVDDFREREDIRRMEWSVRSLDLIPIRHA